MHFTELEEAAYVQDGPKMAQFLFNPLTLSDINRFSKLTVRIRRKFVIGLTLSLKIPPNLKLIS